MARSNELLERIDARMAHSDEVIAEIRDEMRLNREQRQASEEAMLKREDASLRREDAMLKREDVLVEQVQLTREVVRRNEIAFEDSRRALNELVDEVRAQTRAIFALIDELRGGGPNPQTA